MGESPSPNDCVGVSRPSYNVGKGEKSFAPTLRQWVKTLRRRVFTRRRLPSEDKTFGKKFRRNIAPHKP
ncbi:MAG: hypothetical protein LBU34_00620 [Planctomycetaceae bacterium]|nr:hypothetical protein [Planctomycetaceae bacterium]